MILQVQVLAGWGRHLKTIGGGPREYSQPGSTLSLLPRRLTHIEILHDLIYQNPRNYGSILYSRRCRVSFTSSRSRTEVGSLEAPRLRKTPSMSDRPAKTRRCGLGAVWVYYTILYYTILYYTILYYTILYYTIPYYTILYHTIPYHTILYYTILYYTILYYTILYYTILYYTILYYTILYYTILYYTILYYTILYYTILYYTILYYTILYFTILYNSYQGPLGLLGAICGPLGSIGVLRRLWDVGTNYQVSLGVIWWLPKIMGTFLGVPIIRTIVFWGLYWGAPVLGNYHMNMRSMRGLWPLGCGSGSSRYMYMSFYIRHESPKFP